MLAKKIEMIVRQSSVIHKQDVIKELEKTEQNVNWETVFRTLRKLAEQGKIKVVSDGYYSKTHPEDKESERLTKWLI